MVYMPGYKGMYKNLTIVFRKTLKTIVPYMPGSNMVFGTYARFFGLVYSQ